MKKLSICGNKIVDETGAQVILHGINLVCKEPSLGYVTPCDESLFDKFASLGFNVIRMGLIWDGVEPEPMKYNDEYLARIAEQVKWAGECGIYVFLDMHQDLFSALYGDGAPPFATLSDNLPHETGEVWSDAYLISPAVQRAIDNFWLNKPVKDGIGVQDHYAKMWRHIAEYFTGYENIIGYDLMNEPFMGSQSQMVLGSIISTYAKIVLNISNPNPEELSALWFDDKKKQEVLESMADMKIYAKLIEGVKQITSDFEKNLLTPFYSRVANKIREVDKDHFLILESNYFSNMAVESGLMPITNLNGIADPLQLYSPHGYDLVVDTTHYDIYNQERVDLIFDTHQKVQQRLNLPVLVGEWGAFTDFDITYDLSINILKIFERYLWSDTFWCYYDGMGECKYINALKRGYPMHTSGILNHYHYDYDKRELSISVTPKDKLEVIAYHPYAQNVTVTVNNNHVEYDCLENGKIKISYNTNRVEQTIVITATN